jgi:peptidoglycan/LPS O-acetylase OafA/YrhL
MKFNIHRSNTDRDFAIDIWRAIAVVAMIIVHVSSLYLKDSVTIFFWSYLQWVVPAFVFSSIFVANERPNSNIFGVHSFITYLKKRIRRLLMPYYAWLVIYLFVVWLISGKWESGKYIFDSLTLTGGSDYNWLVLLFVYIALVSPIISHFSKKPKHALVLLITMLVGAAYSVLVFFVKPIVGGNFRLTMAIPWISIVIFFVLWCRIWRQGHKTIAYTLIMFSGLFFFLWHVIFVSGRTIRYELYYHKYPPDIYFMLFSFFTAPLGYILSRSIIAMFADIPHSTMGQVISFMSRRSYTIYFVHIICLYLVQEVLMQVYELTYQNHLLLVFVITLSTEFLLMKFGEFINSLTALKSISEKMKYFLNHARV